MNPSLYGSVLAHYSARSVGAYATRPHVCVNLYDLSGNGYHLSGAGNYYQGQRPHIVQNAYKRRQALAFSSSYLSSSLTPGSAPVHSFCMVMGGSFAGENQTIFTIGSSYLFKEWSNIYRLYLNGSNYASTVSASSSEKPDIIVSRFDGTNTKIWINGSLALTISSASSYDSTSTFSLGYYEYSHFLFYEMTWFNSALSDTSALYLTEQLAREYQ